VEAFEVTFPLISTAFAVFALGFAGAAVATFLATSVVSSAAFFGVLDFGFAGAFGFFTVSVMQSSRMEFTHKWASFSDYKISGEFTKQ
jgi:hypothetical protein